MCHAENPDYVHPHQVVCAFLGVVLGRQFPLGRRSPYMNSFFLELRKCSEHSLTMGVATMSKPAFKELRVYNESR